MSLLFNDLVSARKQHRRHSQADGPGGLQVDHQFEFRWLFHGQVAGLCAFENFINEIAVRR
jgi:hypothetical protein